MTLTKKQRTALNSLRDYVNEKTYLNEVVIEENHFAFVTRTCDAVLARSGIVINDPRKDAVLHGNTAYGYRVDWEAAGIKFKYGILLFLISYQEPFTHKASLSRGKWVIDFWNNDPELQAIIIDEDLKGLKMLEGYKGRSNYVESEKPKDKKNTGFLCFLGGILTGTALTLLMYLISFKM